MVLSGVANYVSRRTVQGKQSVYTFLKFVDLEEKEIELQIRNGDNIPSLKRFAPYSIKVDVEQGKYPRYFLVSASLDDSLDNVS